MKPTTMLNAMVRHDRKQIDLIDSFGTKIVLEYDPYQWRSEWLYLWYQKYFFLYYSQMIDMPPLLEYLDAH